MAKQAKIVGRSRWQIIRDPWVDAQPAPLLAVVKPAKGKPTNWDRLRTPWVDPGDLLAPLEEPEPPRPATRRERGIAALRATPRPILRDIYTEEPYPLGTPVWGATPWGRPEPIEMPPASREATGRAHTLRMSLPVANATPWEALAYHVDFTLERRAYVTGSGQEYRWWTWVPTDVAAVRDPAVEAYPLHEPGSRRLARRDSSSRA